MQIFFSDCISASNYERGRLNKKRSDFKVKSQIKRKSLFNENYQKYISVLEVKSSFFNILRLLKVYTAFPLQTFSKKTLLNSYWIHG